MTQTAFTIGGLLGTGFVLGLRHALDPDHVTAVATIVSRTRSVRKASLVGALWGLGHACTLLVVGLAILLLKLSVSAGLAAGLEFAVAVALVILGIRALVAAGRDAVHLHAHAHGGTVHAHLHAHGASASHDHAHMPFVVGMVHGLAGSAALAVLATAAAPTVAQGLSFMAVFAAGSTAGMLATSAAMGAPLLLASRYARMTVAVPAVAGSASIVLGLVMMAGIGRAAAGL